MEPSHTVLFPRWEETWTTFNSYVDQNIEFFFFWVTEIITLMALGYMKIYKINASWPSQCLLIRVLSFHPTPPKKWDNSLLVRNSSVLCIVIWLNQNLLLLVEPCQPGIKPFKPASFQLAPDQKKWKKTFNKSNFRLLKFHSNKLTKNVTFSNCFLFWTISYP